MVTVPIVPCHPFKSGKQVSCPWTPEVPHRARRTVLDSPTESDPSLTPPRSPTYIRGGTTQVPSDIGCGLRGEGRRSTARRSSVSTRSVPRGLFVLFILRVRVRTVYIRIHIQTYVHRKARVKRDVYHTHTYLCISLFLSSTK